MPKTDFSTSSPTIKAGFALSISCRRSVEILDLVEVILLAKVLLA